MGNERILKLQIAFKPRRDLLAAGVKMVQSRAEIERALAARLPAWKLPKAWFIARELPRNGRGKLDFTKLKAQSIV
jgi:acyl-CoA synthetase (AMP-forming)/AMP-acid ligase II